MQPTHTPAVDTATSPVPSDPIPVTTVARTLRDTGRYLFLHGWTQGAYYDDSAGSFTPPCCLVGAIGMVCYGGPVDAPAQHVDDPGFGDFEAAVAYLDRYIVDRYNFDSVYTFNDAKHHTIGDVLVLLTEAAARWELDRLIEAPAADARNTTDAGHVDYPHEPGTLYACPACEFRCHCTNGFQCVACALDTARAGAAVGGAE